MGVLILIPRPVEVNRQKDEWIFKFRNHSDDKNPSTFVLGNLSEIAAQWEPQFQGEFSLPRWHDGSRNRGHLAMRFGQSLACRGRLIEGPRTRLD